MQGEKGEAVGGKGGLVISIEWRNGASFAH